MLAALARGGSRTLRKLSGNGEAAQFSRTLLTASALETQSFAYQRPHNSRPSFPPETTATLTSVDVGASPSCALPSFSLPPTAQLLDWRGLGNSSPGPAAVSATWHKHLLGTPPVASRQPVPPCTTPLLHFSSNAGYVNLGHRGGHGGGGGPTQGTGQHQQRQRPEGVKHIVAVASGKGGVGKSTTAVNLAAALVHSCGLRVGLLDADVYGPSIPRLLNLHGRPQMVKGPEGRPRMVGLQAYGLTCMSMGFLMDEDAAAVWRGPMVMSALEQMLWNTQWGPLDVLLVDMPPGTGDAQITMAQRASLSGAVMVSTPQDLALLDAKRGAIMFRKVNVPILGLIENMSYFACPHCGERTDIFSHGGARATAEAMDMDFLGEIPLQTDIRELSDAGRPLCVADPGSKTALVYSGIADRLWKKLLAQQASKEQSSPKIVME